MEHEEGDILEIIKNYVSRDADWSRILRQAQAVNIFDSEKEIVINNINLN